MENKIDVEFSIYGSLFHLNSEYKLFSALDKHFGNIHKENWIEIHPVYGEKISVDLLRLTNKSKLKLRIYDTNECIQKIRTLCGVKLHIGNFDIVLSKNFMIQTLQPSPNLFSRVVVISNHLDTADDFRMAVKKDLENKNIFKSVESIVIKKRRCVMIKGNIIGYAVELQGLSNDESLKIQTCGIGGKHRFGCGIFVPTKVYK